MTCFYNIVKDCWDKEILNISGLKEESLPRVIPPCSVGGTVTEEVAELLDIPSGIPVVAGGHDQYCASMGAGAVNRGDCLLSCGTAWALLVMTETPVFIPHTGWFPGRHLQKNRFGLMSSVSNGGVILDWMRKNLRIKGTLDKGEENIKVMPDFAGKKGVIRNISLSTTGEDIFHAGMKALCMTVNERLEKINKRMEVKRLFMVGGGTRERMLPGMIEKYTGLKVILPETNEAAGRGAALLAIQKK